jgi:hypothetical protein
VDPTPDVDIRGGDIDVLSFAPSDEDLVTVLGGTPLQPIQIVAVHSQLEKHEFVAWTGVDRNR